MNAFSQRVLRNSAFGFAAQGALKVISFIFNALVIRHLGAEVFGEYAAVAAFGALFVAFADLGLSTYTVRETVKLRREPDGLCKIGALTTNVLALRLILSVLVAWMTIATAWLTGQTGIMLLAIALNSMSMLLYAFQGTASSVLSGYERLGSIAVLLVLSQAIFLSIGGLLLWLGSNYIGLIIASLIALFVTTLLFWFRLRQTGLRFGPLAPALWLGLLHAALPFGLINLGIGFTAKFDSVVLSVTRGNVETGYYNAAYGIVFTAFTISNVINTALFPSLTGEVTSHPDRLVPIAERILLYLMVIALPIATIGSALAEPIILFLYGEAYHPAVPALRILILTTPFGFLAEFFGYLIVIRSSKERLVARSVLIGGGVNVVINLLLVPVFGFVMAAVTTLFTDATIAVQHAWNLRDVLQRMNLLKSLLLPLMAAMLSGGVAMWMLSHSAFLPAAFLALAVYASLLVLLRLIGPTELDFLRRLIPRPKRSLS